MTRKPRLFPLVPSNATLFERAACIREDAQTTPCPLKGAATYLLSEPDREVEGCDAAAREHTGCLVHKSPVCHRRRLVRLTAEG